jgi:hypothetical protein
MAFAVPPQKVDETMKYKYAVHATQTAYKEGTITVVARNEEEAEVIANESQDWDWDDATWNDEEIDSIKPIGTVEDDEDEE